MTVRNPTPADAPAAQNDLFISYAPADSAWVQGYLLDALTAAGVRCITEATFALGVPRLNEFERAIEQSRRILLVLSPAYLADGYAGFIDLMAQSWGIETATWPVIPLLLQTVVLPPRLAMLTALDATDVETWPAVLARLTEELQHPLPAPPAPLSCPYPGMVPFQAKDARFFNGRETEIAAILQFLRQQSFLLLVGPSGCGKSSLLYAGVLPRLAGSTYWPASFWVVRSLRPGATPMQTLSEALGGDPTHLETTLPALLASQAPGERVLLVVDQFEELFTLAPPVEQARSIAAVKALRADSRSAVILTMRADFYPDLMNSDLWPIGTQRLEIAVLRGAALRAAIQQPAQAMGVYLETGLLERLLADAADEPGVLPLLQETMILLWATMQRRLLTLYAYERLGTEQRSGLSVALANKADATLASLTPEQQRLARRTFLRLVQFGEGRPDTRRQQTVANLCSPGDDPALFEATLQALVDNRLLTLSGEADGGGRKVDISHEALITGWQVLREWVLQRGATEQTRRRLEAKAADWVRLGRGLGGLLDESELAEAEEWAARADASDLGSSDDLLAMMRASHAALESARQQKAAQVRALAMAEQDRRAAEMEVSRQERLARWGALAVFAVMVVTLAAEAASQPPLLNKVSPLGLVSLEMAGTKANVARILDAWGPQTRIYTAFIVGFNIFQLIITAISLFAATIWSGNVLRNVHRCLGAARIPLAALVVLLALLNIVQDFGVLGMVLQGPAQAAGFGFWPEFAWACTVAKDADAVITISYILLGALIGLRRTRHPVGAG